GSTTVAEHTFALILSLTRKIYQSVNQAKHLNFEHKEIQGVDLEGKTIGIIGLGKIGEHVLRISRGFGMNALVYNRSRNPKLKELYGFEYTDLARLLKESDVITLHIPYNENTKHIINKDNILTVKKGSYLINTSRGGLIETEAIVIGLDKHILSGVALDVMEEEKEMSEEAVMLTREYRSSVNMQNVVYNHILMNHPLVLITPHNAFNSREALLRITYTTIENVKAYFSGNPINVVA
ncbi:hydroxyacid dehydrogenase, partial [Candidatus Microgenomates bacterium]|nr:hydroxyacid dehydrogenase [Candidatus Microgenomates bacterium]